MKKKNLVSANTIILSTILIIAGISFFSREKKINTKEKGKKFEVITEKKEAKILPVSDENDYILGNYDKAKLFIVEYSDTQCPFCKQYHDNELNRLEDKYLGDDRIAFVYRPFPLLNLHPTAATEALALECVARLGGEDKFFDMKKKIFTFTKSNNKNATELLSSLPKFAEELDINKESFEDCLKNNEEAKKKIDRFYRQAIESGIKGTPTVFIQMKNGESIKIPANADIISSSIDNYLNN